MLDDINFNSFNFNNDPIINMMFDDIYKILICLEPDERYIYNMYNEFKLIKTGEFRTINRIMYKNLIDKYKVDEEKIYYGSDLRKNNYLFKLDNSNIGFYYVVYTENNIYHVSRLSNIIYYNNNIVLLTSINHVIILSNILIPYYSKCVYIGKKINRKERKFKYKYTKNNGTCIIKMKDRNNILKYKYIDNVPIKNLSCEEFLTGRIKCINIDKEFFDELLSMKNKKKYMKKLKKAKKNYQMKKFKNGDFTFIEININYKLHYTSYIILSVFLYKNDYYDLDNMKNYNINTEIYLEYYDKSKLEYKHSEELNFTDKYIYSSNNGIKKIYIKDENCYNVFDVIN